MNTHQQTSAPSVLNPVKEIQINNQKVEVRELTWPRMIKFLEMLSANSSAFLNAEGKWAFSADKLSGLILNAGELCSYLMVHTTARDQAWVDELTTSQAFDVLDAALEISLHPEVIGKAKKAGGRFALAFGVNGATAKLATESLPRS